MITSEELFMFMLGLQTDLHWSTWFLWSAPFLFAVFILAAWWGEKKDILSLFLAGILMLTVLTISSLVSLTVVMDTKSTAASSDPQVASFLLKNKLEVSKRRIVYGY